MSDQTLLDLVTQLHELDYEATIFAAEPWRPQSRAKLVSDVDTTEPRDGITYFLEVNIALDIVSGFDVEPQIKCDRLIEYAINDC